ncbi:MAG: hypothetical protein IKW64_05685 [Clostridia bacterium]|nr:hypothetical protein [Clostridia bacterium]
MPDYKKLYFKLFNDITDVINKLKQTQIDAEEMYLRMYDEEDKKLQAKKLAHTKKKEK